MPDRATGTDASAEVRQAAYRYLFENNGSAFGAQVAAYCIGEGPSGHLRDPDAAALAAFSGHRPQVLPASACGRGEWATVTATGERALIVHVADLVCASATRCTFQGGYYEANMSASQGRYQAERVDGRWRIQPIGPQAVS